jgi:hypothetical protein
MYWLYDVDGKGLMRRLFVDVGMRQLRRLQLEAIDGL